MKLETGKYYYCKTDHMTMRYDGYAMQAWFEYIGGSRIGWIDVPPLDTLEEVTWGTRAIPLQDFSECEHY